MQRTVVAVFENERTANEALDALADEGFPRDRMRISASGASAAGDTVVPDDVDEPVTGGARQAERQPSLGDRIASFFGFGDDEDTYQEAVRRGHCVLLVDAADDAEIDRAEVLLDRFDPIDIDEQAAVWRQDGLRSDGLPRDASLDAPLDAPPDAPLDAPSPLRTATRTDTRTGTGTGIGAEADAVLPVVEESLKVGKREVQRGGVRVISRATERPVEAEVTLREETASVTRTPVDRPLAAGDDAFADREIEVRESREEPVIGKTARVVEEVKVGKQSRTRTQKVRDTVRRTDVDVREQPGEADPGGGNGATVYGGPERRRPGSLAYTGPERRAA